MRRSGGTPERLIQGRFRSDNPRAWLGAMVLLGATVLSAVAFTSGGLPFVFDTGHHLNVRPRSHGESWSASPGRDLEADRENTPRAAFPKEAGRLR